jgi:hypothetical protein
MSESLVPATAELDGRRVAIQVQLNQTAVPVEDEDPEREVGIFRRRSDEPFPLEDLGRSIGAIASAMASAIAKVAPAEAEVEFGVDVGVEAGQLTSLLVKGSSTATLKVRLLWVGASSPDSEPSLPSSP